MKATKDFSPEAMAQMIAERQHPCWKPMTKKEIRKQEARNAKPLENNETVYEINRRNILNNLPSSLR